MRQNEEYRSEVSIRDCFFDVLYHWRSLLMAALLGVILLGGFALLKNREIRAGSAADSEVGTAVQEQQEPGNTMYSALLRSDMDYQAHSILMRVDPKKEWQARAFYTVRTDRSGDEAVAIAAAYQAAVYSHWDREKAAALYGGESGEYAAELFRIRPIEGSAVFMIQAIGETEDMANRGLAMLEESVAAFSESDAQVLGVHRIEKLTGYTIQTADAETEAKQTELAQGIPKYQEGISQNAASVNADGTSARQRSPGKYAVIGLVLGAVAMVFFYVLRFMFSNKMQNSDVLREQLGLPVYGVFSHSRAFRPGKGMDRWIENWEFRGKMRDRNTVTAGICALLNDRSESEILLISTLPLSRIQPFYDAIRAGMKEKKELRIEAELLKNHQAIGAASQAQAILLIEEQFVSRTQDVLRMAEILKICGTPVIGAVAI